MIEALEVPHTEVELVLLNGESVGFEWVIFDGDRLAVYPSAGHQPATVRAQPLRVLGFVADAHLGGLARQLQVTGVAYWGIYGVSGSIKRHAELGLTDSKER